MIINHKKQIDILVFACAHGPASILPKDYQAGITKVAKQEERYLQKELS
jgi:hypothetical protein